MKNTRAIIIGAISILSVALIIYFAMFFGKADNNSVQITTQGQKEYTISFATDTLHYTKGTNLMQGVSAISEDGEDLTADVTVSCKPTSNILTKTLTYSVNKSGYAIKSFERKLIIDGSYNGPSITVGDGNIEVPLDKVNSLSSIINRSGIIKTDDGFGGKCSITAEILVMDEVELGDYVALITAENMLGDTTSVKISVTVVDAEQSIIKLNTSSITLNVGDKFEPQDYIKSAISKEYGDVSQMVMCDTDIDTSKAGIYRAEYTIHGIKELQNEKAVLYVTVK